MEAIKKIAQEVLEGLRRQQGGSAAGGAEAALKKILTKQEAKHIKFNYSKGGVISVNVDSSSWLYNFNLKKEYILGALKKECAGLKSIRFRIGEIK